MGPFPSDNIAVAAEWLHSGSAKAVCDVDIPLHPVPEYPPALELEELAKAAPGRVIARVSSLLDPEICTDAVVDATIQRARDLHLTGLQLLVGEATRAQIPDFAARFNKARGSDSSPGYVALHLEATDFDWSNEEVAQLHAKYNVRCVGACSATGKTKEEDTPALSGDVQGSSYDLAGAFIGCLRTDRPDGLYTTVVVDRMGICLGLVYSSQESVRASVEECRGIYYSRSRNGLWRKGDSSGAVQTLVSLDIDCDSDALRFTVDQLGDPAAFCHRNCRSCWGHIGGLGDLERTLFARKVSAPEGSYTKRLFNDPELLRHKLVEEAQELSEAVEPDHVANEAADVIYFALVRCAAAGVTIADVEACLDQRSLKLQRRPGNAKKSRIDAAAAILGEKKTPPSPPAPSPPPSS